MKRNCRRLFVVVLCLAFVVLGMPTNSTQMIAMEDLIASEDIDVEYMENQIESIEQYRKMLDNFNKDAKVRSAEEQIYDENYGGSYIDNEGKLVVLLVENDTQGIVAIEEDTGNVDIKTEKCEYSFNDLLLVINTINENLNYLLDNGITITEMYEDIYTNKVKIGVYELNKMKIDIIKEIIDKPYIEIYNTNFYAQTNDTTYIKGGEEIVSLDNGGSSSIGFCATRNGVEGIVIAGHAGNYSNEIFLYDGSPLGVITATAYENNSNADAAFLKITNSSDITNLIGEVAICHNVGTSISDFPVGATVYKYGKESGLTSGTITNNFYTCGYDSNNNGVADIFFLNQSNATYYSVEGDSGSPVFAVEGMYNGKYTCQLLGIHSGSIVGGDAIFSKYYKIVEELNVSAKTY